MSNSLQHLPPNLSTLLSTLSTFVETRCIPAETEYEQHLSQFSGRERWTLSAVPPCIDRLKVEAQKLGLWNLFLPKKLPEGLLPPGSVGSPSVYLSHREYGLFCEQMGRSFLAAEVCNCSAPDTGNMEVFLKHGTRGQQRRYLLPLLRGEIRSAFCMTEPDVASSDATNIQTTLTKITDPNDPHKIRYILNGRKWWSTGAMDPRCEVALVLAKMDYSRCGDTASSSKHGAHTVVIVPVRAEGVRMVRPLTVFGYDDAPHGHAEVEFENVSVGESDLILGEGRGFEIAQSRLGAGRVHHCMRAVGLAARCYELMLQRTLERKTFGKLLYQHGMCQEMISDSASDLEMARLLTLSCAAHMDEQGAQKARDKIAMIKVAVPEITLRIVDRAVQVYGGAGVCGDFPLARALVGLRTLRIADGPDAVHKRTLARIEVRKAMEESEKVTGVGNSKL